jgi:hypothetical protein
MVEDLFSIPRYLTLQLVLVEMGRRLSLERVA